MKQAIFLSWLILSIFTSFAYPGKVLDAIKTPGYFPTGLTFDGKYLWIADRQEDKIFQIDPKNGLIKKAINAPGYWPVGLTYDGTYLWNVDIKQGIPMAENYKALIYKIDPEDGTILHTVNAPSNNARGLAWDGQYLWCTDNRTDEIIQFDPQDGTTIRSFKAPASDPQGLTFDGKYLWCSDRLSDELYMIDPKTGTVIIVTDAPGKYARGMCFDGKYLWAVDHQSKKIFKLVQKDQEKLLQYGFQEARITYTHQSTNFGPGTAKKIDVHIAVPVNRDNQEITGEIKYIPEPTDFVTDKWGQKTAHFKINDLQAGSSKVVKMIVNARISSTRYFVFPDEVGTLNDIPQNIKNTYLEDHVKYQKDHEVIQTALKEAVGEEKNPYWIARNIYNYLMQHMYYEMAGGWNTAPTVLARGNGSCSEYSFIYISMCRAAGIPARYVGSVVVRGDLSAMDDVFHRWVEIYLPNYGWIPVDPSGGDSQSPKHQAYYFGNLANRYLITTESGGGSETMGWTYNSNEFWITEPKTNIVFENFADWEPLQD